MYDARGVSIYSNKAMNQLLERKASSHSPVSLQDIEKGGEFSDLPAQTAFEKHISVSKQITWKHKKTFFSTAVPVLNEEGKLRYIISYIHDMTEAVRLNENLHNTEMVLKRYRAELAALRSFIDQHEQSGFIAESPLSKKVFFQILKVASAQIPVMLLGESGTGKSFVARAIHQSGPRKDKPFIVVNCGAIPENLMEAELFGYEKGSFTGANSRQKRTF